MKSETNIQRELWKLIEAYRMPGVLIWHTPNGEKRSPRTAQRLKEMGVVPGVPDFGYIAKFTAGFLELKRADGRLSDDQLKFMRKAGFQGIKVDVAYSVIEGADILQAVGVLDPTIKFTTSDESKVIRRAQGRTVRRRAVRPTSTEA